MTDYVSSSYHHTIIIIMLIILLSNIAWWLVTVDPAIERVYYERFHCNTELLAKTFIDKGELLKH